MYKRKRQMENSKSKMEEKSSLPPLLRRDRKMMVR